MRAKGFLRKAKEPAGKSAQRAMTSCGEEREATAPGMYSYSTGLRACERVSCVWCLICLIRLQPAAASQSSSHAEALDTGLGTWRA